MIAPDSPAPSYIHRQKPNKAVVPSVLPDCAVIRHIVELSYCLAHHLTNTLGVLFRSNQTGHLEVCPRLSTAMMEKRLFWREFWLLWSAGAITSAIFGISADSNYPGCRYPSLEGSLTKASVSRYGSDRDYS